MSDFFLWQIFGNGLMGGWLYGWLVFFNHPDLLVLIGRHGFTHARGPSFTSVVVRLYSLLAVAVAL
jgi:hypothetical protein